MFGTSAHTSATFFYITDHRSLDSTAATLAAPAALSTTDEGRSICYLVAHSPQTQRERAGQR